MLISLRNNQLLLKRPPAFSRIKKHIQTQTAREVSLCENPLSSDDLTKIRKRIIGDLRQKSIIQKRFFIVGASFISSLIIVSIYWLTTIKYFNFFDQNLVLPEVTIDQKALSFYLKDGNNWLLEKKYHNARFQFELALKIDSNNYQAHYALLKALQLECETSENSCAEAEQQKLKMDTFFGH